VCVSKWSIISLSQTLTESPICPGRTALCRIIPPNRVATFFNLRLSFEWQLSRETHVLITICFAFLTRLQVSLETKNEVREFSGDQVEEIGGAGLVAGHELVLVNAC